MQCNAVILWQPLFKLTHSHASFTFQMVHSKDQVMKGFDNVMDRVSESVSESSLKVKNSFNTVLDKMSKSRDKMMVEIDNVIDNLAASKVLSEIRALPRGRC